VPQAANRSSSLSTK